MHNEKLISRVCALIAMSYALKPEDVWEIYLETCSLDKTIETISSQKR